MSEQPQEPAETAAAESQAPEAARETVDVAGLQAELAKAKDDMLRALAEAENIRRRAERQTQDARAYAIDKFARDLLPVADTLARAIEAISAEARAAMDDQARNLVEGVELTERALIEVFARNQVRRVGAKGEAFDPNLHQAVAQAPSEAPANTIAEVMQPGYVLGERTLRPAMVVVSVGSPAKPPEQQQQGASGNIDIQV